MAFIDYCVSHRIIVLIVPPHTTHRLQPLDVGCFAPLSHYFSKAVSDLMTKGNGFVRNSKQLFWSPFKPAFTARLSEANILSAFKKTGIWPMDQSIVIDVLKRPVTLERDFDTNYINTPMKSKAIRRFQ